MGSGRRFGSVVIWELHISQSSGFGQIYAQCSLSEHLQEFSKEGEFHTLSMDCTVKIALATIGQASQAHVRKRPSTAAFTESEHRRKVLTVRGLTGAVLLLSPVREESANEMAQALKEGITTDHRERVQFVATDKPSGKMFVFLKQVHPNLQCLYLDTVHEHAVRIRLCAFQVCRLGHAAKVDVKVHLRPKCIIQTSVFSARTLSRSWTVSVGTRRGSSMQSYSWDGQTDTHIAFMRSAGDC